MIRKRRIAVVVSSGLIAAGLVAIPFTAQGTTTDHTRVILDAAKLSSLRQRAQAGDPEWTALKDKCDSYVTGTVEWPEGNDYPDGGSIGEGYQGDGYFNAVSNLGICYQVALGVDPTSATAYGAKGADVLEHMSAPSGDPHYQVPTRDDGYGIRFYGLGMALGFDWLHDAMSATERTRVYTSLDAWIDSYEATGYERDEPASNYFAGYYSTKAVAGLATEGDDPRAAAQWSDFLTRVQGRIVQPYYAANLSGGGWPDGQNYGPLAAFNMILPAVAAETAKGIDLVHATAPYAFPSGTATWYMHNLWPGLKRVDDRGTMRVEGEPAPAPVKFISQLAGMMQTWNDPQAAAFHKFASDVRTANPDTTGTADSLWSDFVFWDPSASSGDYRTGSLSSYAPGMEMGAVRSGWDTGAVWGSLNAGPYTGNPDAQEELFDSGSLAVAHGNTPFLVNAAGQIFRGGVPVDDFRDQDNSGPRGLYNVFYTDSPTPTGQGTQRRSDGAKTKMTAFDAQKDYTFMEAGNLEDMYPRSGTRTITGWTRDVVYLNPNLFVVYDRTTTSSPSAGQWMRFHFAGVPAKEADPSSGVTRYDIGSGSSYAGTMDSLLPAGHTEAVTPNILSGTDVSRIDVKPGTAAAQNQWLNVIDAASTPAQAAKTTRLSAADGNVLQGAVTGTVLQSGDGNYAVLAGTGAATSVISTPVEYHLPSASTRNIITGLAPDTAYSVTTANDASGLAVTVTAGSGPKTSPAGVLEFTTSSSGVTTAPGTSASPTPTSTPIPR